MSTVGNTTNPTFGFVFTGTNNEMGERFTMPSPGGLITNLHGYFSVNSGGPVTGYLCLWDASGNLLADTAVSVANGTQSAGGQTWHTAALASSVYVASGATIYLGFWVPKSNGLIFSTYSTSSTEYWNGSFATGGPGALGTTSTGHHDFGAYADYTPSVAHVRRSGAWVSGPPYVHRSGVETSAVAYVRRSGAWVAGT